MVYDCSFISNGMDFYLKRLPLPPKLVKVKVKREGETERIGEKLV